MTKSKKSNENKNDSWKNSTLKTASGQKSMTRGFKSEGFIFKFLMSEQERSNSMIKTTKARSKKDKKSKGGRNISTSQRHIPTPAPQTARNRKTTKIKSNKFSKKGKV